MEQNKLFVPAFFLVSAFLLLTPFYTDITAYAIDVEAAKEQPCFPITKFAEVDGDFLNSSTGPWFYPVMSRLDLYYTSLDIAHTKAREIQDNEVYYDSCIWFDMPNMTMLGHGFGGKLTKYTITPENGTDDEYSGCHFTTDTGRSGVSYPVLTDNSTFMFTASCFDDNQMTWGVTSSLKVLPKETVKEIYDHAESLGFKREYFTALRYDTCNLDFEDNTIADFEL